MTRLFTLITALMLLASMSGFAQTAAPTEKQYSVYFLDRQGWGAENTLVHIWGTAGDLTAWAANENMEHAGKYKMVGSTPVPVLEYHFDYAGEPQHIIIRKPQGYQTADLKYTDGALYTTAGLSEDPGFDYLSASRYSLYFYDTLGWGMADTQVTVSVPDGTVLGTTKTDTGRYYAVDDTYYPVYRYDIDLLGTVGHIQFGNGTENTAALAATDGALYHFGGNNVATTVIPDAESLLIVREFTYTIYFCDPDPSEPRQWSADQWAVHLWDGNDTPYQVWADNSTLTDTGKFVEITTKGVTGRYPVYSFTFTWDRMPAGVIFHSALYGTDANQTKDLAFSDGALYCFSPKAVAMDNQVVAPGSFILRDKMRKTIYYADTYSWGNENILAHIWGDGGDYRPFAYSPAMSATGRYARIGDIYRPVYELTIESMYEDRTEIVQFRRQFEGYAEQTCNFELVDGALYQYIKPGLNGRPMTDFELVDNIPATPGTVYLHLGANQILTGLWGKPRAHFCNGSITEVPVTDNESDEELMYMVDEGLWGIDIDDIQKYSNIVFYYLGTNGQAHLFPANEPAYYDVTTYARYIYDIGTTCVYQSYMTPAQYLAARDVEKETVYLIGNKSAGFEDDNMLLTSAVGISEEEGVFFKEIVAGPQDNPADFKLSWVNVKQYAETAGEMYRYENQRGWATFNLGLYGCETRGVDWIQTEHDANNNRVILVPPNTSMKYNSFNQYGWRVRGGASGAHGDIEEGRTYWLVIDTHGDDHSVTLLDFDPNPSVAVEPGPAAPVRLGYERAQTLQTGLELKGAANNGAAFFDYVNVASGVATITAAPGNHLDAADFSVTYTVYMDDVPVIVHKGSPTSITVPFIPIGKNVRIALRARYTDTETGISFCSRYTDGEFVTLPGLKAPELEELKAVLLPHQAVDNPDTHTSFDAAVNLGYTLDTDLAAYADFAMEAADGYHAGHPEYADGGHLTAADTYPGNTAIGAVDWSAYADGDYTDSHNWAKTVRKSGSLPVNLKNVLNEPADSRDFEVNINLSVHAVYPFLVQKAAPQQTTTMSKNVSLTAPDLPEYIDLDSYAIVPVYTHAAHSIRLGASDVTGVEDVTTSDVDTPAEYYDMRGIRIKEPITPGIYIERRGSQARKIMIR